MPTTFSGKVAPCDPEVARGVRNHKLFCPPEAEAVFRYHARTTHFPGRYAPGPGFLDWANQPEPFRSYAGAPVVELPVAGEDLTASWGDLHRPGSVPPRALDRGSAGGRP